MSTVVDRPRPDTPDTGRKPQPKPPSRFRVGRTVRYLLLIFFVLLVLIPAYVLFVTSFKGVGEADPSRTWALPENWSVGRWVDAWNSLAPAIGRTFELVIPASLISSFLGSVNGYVLSRWRFPGANVVFTLMLFGMFLPYQAVIIPLLKLFLFIGVPNGIPSLILLHVVYGLPITTLIFRNYYESVPHDLIEASRMDGAGILRTYGSVIFPLSGPGFVVTIIWQFTSAWNDFLFAIFFSTPSNGPVTLALNNLANGAQLQDYGTSMSGALLASLPTLIVYILLGKYFLGGMTSGSVKG